ncbi:MAG: hypothetical protein WDM79_12340 [Terricaulis sp.]
MIDARTGSVNLRPQYCVPLPFFATTADAHRLIVETRVQFSLNRDLLKYVYQLEDFGLALETRIHSAFRAEIGMRQDEVLRGALHEVEAGVIERLRQAERDGDEAGEAGMALGVNFHTSSFTYSEADADAPVTLSAMRAIAGPGTSTNVAGAVEAARVTARAQGVLALRPQQLDQLGRCVQRPRSRRHQGAARHPRNADAPEHRRSARKLGPIGGGDGPRAWPRQRGRAARCGGACRHGCPQWRGR